MVWADFSPNYLLSSHSSVYFNKLHSNTSSGSAFEVKEPNKKHTNHMKQHRPQWLQYGKQIKHPNLMKFIKQHSSVHVVRKEKARRKSEAACWNYQNLIPHTAPTLHYSSQLIVQTCVTRYQKKKWNHLKNLPTATGSHSFSKWMFNCRSVLVQIHQNHPCAKWSESQRAAFEVTDLIGTLTDLILFRSYIFVAQVPTWRKRRRLIRFQCGSSVWTRCLKNLWPLMEKLASQSTMMVHQLVASIIFYLFLLWFEGISGVKPFF